MQAKPIPRKPQPTRALIKMACPSCRTRITVDPASLRGRIQCPRCLRPIDPTPPAPAAETEPAAQDPAASLHERLERLEQERAQRLALQSDLELLSAENTTLKATLEGLQTERKDLLKRGPRPAPATPRGAAAADVQGLTAERDALAERLRHAEAALADVGMLVLRLQHLEQCICELGANYHRALEALHALEREREAHGRR